MSDSESLSSNENGNPIYRNWEDNNCIQADYEFRLEFRTPFNLREVDEYYIKWGVLNVRIGDEWLEFEPSMEPSEHEWKWAEHTEVIPQEYSDFNHWDDHDLEGYIDTSGNRSWEAPDSKFSNEKEEKATFTEDEKVAFDKTIGN